MGAGKNPLVIRPEKARMLLHTSDPRGFMEHSASYSQPAQLCIRPCTLFSQAYQTIDLPACHSPACQAFYKTLHGRKISRLSCVSPAAADRP